MKKFLVIVVAMLSVMNYAQSGNNLDARYDFKALTPDGDELALGDLIGKTDYVLVDFWASWCGPCRYGIQKLKALYASQPIGKLQILSCSTDQDESSWRKALDQEKMPWPQIWEANRYYCSDKYDVQYIPYLVLFDRQGNLLGDHISVDEVTQIISK